MARIGGRSTGIALVAGLLCVSVLAGLAYLAAPLAPRDPRVGQRQRRPRHLAGVTSRGRGSSHGQMWSTMLLV